MKTNKAKRVLSGLASLVFAAVANGGEIVASNYVSVGFGGTSSGWTTNETGSVNIPTYANNPGQTKVFTNGDFVYMIFIGGVNGAYSGSGPGFTNRIIGSGATCMRSLDNMVLVKAHYIGTNSAYANYFHLNIDQISIYAAKAGTSSNLWWSEDTKWHEGVSPSNTLTGDYSTWTSYRQLLWNPPNVTLPDTFSATRVFRLPQSPQVPTDGFELKCSAFIERRTTSSATVVPVAASSNFSIGYGWQQAGSSWNTNETASFNTPVTAPNSGTFFNMGDFRIKISVTGTDFPKNFALDPGAYTGSGFTGRQITYSPGGDGGSSYSSNVTVSVQAIYTGKLAKATTAFRLNIDQISVYAGGTNAVASSTTNAAWIETTAGACATSAPIATVSGGVSLAGYKHYPSYWSQLNWNPAEPAVTYDGATNLTRTFTLTRDPNDVFLVDGFEIAGSAEVVISRPAGSVVIVR